MDSFVCCCTSSRRPSSSLCCSSKNDRFHQRPSRDELHRPSPRVGRQKQLQKNESRKISRNELMTSIVLVLVSGFLIGTRLGWKSPAFCVETGFADAILPPHFYRLNHTVLSMSIIALHPVFTRILNLTASVSRVPYRPSGSLLDRSLATNIKTLLSPRNRGTFMCALGLKYLNENSQNGIPTSM